MISELSAVVPVYNEEEGIETSLRSLREALAASRLRHEIVVVDDGSTDRTPEILARLDGLRVVAHPANRGYGASVKRGIREAACTWILITDGDDSYPAANLDRLLPALDSADMVVGARALDAIPNPALWNVAKRLTQAALSRFLGSRIPDLNSGMRIFRRRLASELEPILSNRFSYTSGLTVGALRAGCAVEFVPIEYRDRRGRSKVRPSSFTPAFVRSVVRALLYARRLTDGRVADS